MSLTYERISALFLMVECTFQHFQMALMDSSPCSLSKVESKFGIGSLLDAMIYKQSFKLGKKFLVSKKTVVLRWWESETGKFGFIICVVKALC